MLANKVVRSLFFAVAFGLLITLGLWFVISPKTNDKTPVSVASAANNGPAVVVSSESFPTSTPAPTTIPIPATTNIATAVATAATEPAAIPTNTPRPIKPVSIAAPATPEELARLKQTWLAGIQVTVYVPESLKPEQTTQLVIALHGMSGQGGVICRGLLNFAEQTGAVVLAPTFNYSPDWQDPNTVASEDGSLTGKLNEMIGDLEPVVGTHFKQKIILYGFSRGAQLAHRFALLYPEKTLAVAALSAGSYTLPYKTYAGKDNKVMPFPFGVGDLRNYTSKPFDPAAFRKVHFMVEVGQDDNDPNQTPRAWDALGKSRAERAETFYQTIKQMGLDAHLMLFPGTGHQESPAMRESALNFFQKVLAA